MAIDKEIEERIEQPVSEEAQQETRLTPAEAVARMRINVPVRGNRKLRTLIERINADDQVKGWWHVSNVNAVARMEINDHSWVHIQIVANIALNIFSNYLSSIAKTEADFPLLQPGADPPRVGIAQRKKRPATLRVGSPKPKINRK